MLHLLKVQGSTAPATPQNQTLINAIQHYNKVVNAPFRSTVEKIDNYTAEEVKKRVLASQGVSYPIATANETQKSTIGTALSQFANLADQTQGGLPNSPKFNSSTAKALAIDPTANYSITVVEGTDYQPKMYKVNVQGKAGETEFEVTPEQKQALFGNQFEASPAAQAFQPYDKQIKLMRGYSTALEKGPSSHANAFLNKIDFPAVENYGVKANIIQPEPGKYSIRVSAYDPVTEKWYDDLPFPRNSLITSEQVVPLLQGLTDSALFELLNEKPATAKDIQAVKQASKKPL